MLYTESSCANIVYLSLQKSIHPVMIKIRLSIAVCMLKFTSKPEYNGTEIASQLEKEL